ncbi:MAG: hypothetical protein NTX25_13570 [Proteobacteria bacterium]|nr:hypothetical protein [Pseudomonadota bacterium]
MLVRDAEGNFRLPWVQRYRSPYFVGEASATASSGFRSEPRFRRASILLVDEAFQQYNTLQANSQVMSYVPMDQSGLDHDFFVQKYEPAIHSGTFYNNSPTGSGDWPLQASTAGVWTSNAAACEDEFSRTGNFSLSACGNGSAISATNVILKSKMGTSPLVSLDQGAMWKACRNTAIVSGSGYAYYESLISDSEWVKAADWGDVAETGTISQSQYLKNIGAQVAPLESDFVSIPNLITTISSTAVTGFSSTSGIRLGQLVSGTGIAPNTVVTNIVPNSSITLSSPATASGVTVTLKFQNKGSCNTNTSSPQMSGSVQTEFCRSRYGMADHVGNVFEFSSGQQLSAIGFDNGLDGLWLARTLPTTSSSLGRYDLLRGLPQLSGQSAIVGNADFYSYTAAMRGASIHGGSFTNSSQGGRWTLNVNQAPSSPSSLVGGRCRR